jgi:hypothetical protein
VTLRFFIWVAVEEAVNTTSSESSGGDALTFDTGPWAWLVAAADCFDDSRNYSSFGGLLPLLSVVTAATASAAASVLIAI